MRIGDNRKDNVTETSYKLRQLSIQIYTKPAKEFTGTGAELECFTNCQAVEMHHQGEDSAARMRVFLFRCIFNIRNYQSWKFAKNDRIVKFQLSNNR